MDIRSLINHDTPSPPPSASPPPSSPPSAPDPASAPLPRPASYVASSPEAAGSASPSGSYRESLSGPSSPVGTVFHNIHVPPAKPNQPNQPTMFHHFIAESSGIKDIGMTAAAPPPTTPPLAGRKPANRKPVERNPPRAGVSGRRKDKPEIDPATVADGKGDKSWEARRDKDGGPKEGLHAFWGVKKKP